MFAGPGASQEPFLICQLDESVKRNSEEIQTSTGVLHQVLLVFVDNVFESFGVYGCVIYGLLYACINPQKK